MENNSILMSTAQTFSFLNKKIKILLWFLIFSFLVSLVLTNSFSEFHLLSFIALPFLYTITFIFWFKSRNNSSSLFLLKLVVLSFGIKLITVFITAELLENYMGFPFLSMNDDYTYNESAISILQRWQSQGFGFYSDLIFSTGFYSGYPNFSALMMYFLGDSFYVPRIGNAIFSSITIIFFYKTMRLMHNEEVAKFSTLLFSLSAVFVIFSSLQLKDTILVFFLAVILFAVAKLWNNRDWKSFLYLIFGMTAILFFRAAIILPLIVSSIFIYLFTVKKSLSTFFRNIAFLVFTAIAIKYMWDYLENLKVLASYDYYLESRFGSRLDGDRLLGENSRVSKLGGIILLAAPFYLLFSVFLPIPLSVALPDKEILNYHYLPLVEIYSLLPFIIISIYVILKNKRLYSYGLFLVLFFTLYKAGQAMSISILDSRQSLPVFYVGYLLIGYNFKQENSVYRKKKIYRYSILIMSLLIFIYAFIKLYIRGLV